MPPCKKFLVREKFAGFWVRLRQIPAVTRMSAVISCQFLVKEQKIWVVGGSWLVVQFHSVISVF
jgi:hypothetical protein